MGKSLLSTCHQFPVLVPENFAFQIRLKSSVISPQWLMSFLYFNNKIETVYSYLIIEVNFQLEAKDD